MINTKQFYTQRLNFDNLNNEMLNYFLNVFQNNTVYIPTQIYHENINSLKMRRIALRKKIIENLLENN